jgi:cytochrome c oxidase accessory protein FixG
MSEKKMSEESSGAVEKELYKKREKIYPREVHGKFAVLRLLAMVALLGYYYIMPWIKYDGRQAILVDLADNKLYLFGAVLWPQDLLYLALLLMVMAFALFFFTNLAGRLWCGYACPQTVWTEIFMWFEQKIVGDRPKQMKMDKASWSNPEKIMRVGGKHVAWLIFSLFTGFTFVGWFSPIDDLFSRLLVWDLGGWEIFFLFFFSLATWGNAGFLREQVCLYMCPYARFQSVMFDRDTLIITYDEQRGEPRGKLEKGAVKQGNGDCIDCGICVQACPTGIDIRQGLQYECIACAACIDACDDVMQKIGKPKGLVKYTTENEMEGGTTHLLRPRSIMYGLVFVGFIAFLVLLFMQRVPLELNIIRDRMALYSETNEGLIENVYTLRIMNMDTESHTFNLSVTSEDLPGVHLVSSETAVNLKTGEVGELPVRIQASPDEINNRRSTEVFFELKAVSKPELSIKEPARFLYSPDF